VSIVDPNEPYYSVGAGNYMWINVTVHDTPNMAFYFSQYSVTINDSRFVLEQAPVEIDALDFWYYYYNISAIPDGPLNVLITAMDPAGNVGTGLAHTTVDNTAPQLLWIKVVDQNGVALNLVHGTYWMSASTSNISVAAAFYSQQSAGLTGVYGNIYFNTSMYAFVNSTTPPIAHSWMPGVPGVFGYYVTGSNLVTLNITLLDSSSPTANRYTFTWTVMRETTLPSVPSYVTTQTICGGFIIWGLTATDNVGISYYNIILNGSSEELSPLDLNSPTLDYYPISYCCTIQNITVIDLFGLFGHGFTAGSVANITIDAVNFGGNTGPPLTFFVTVLAGEWCPIEMFPKWNLISFPLIPSSTAPANIYSLLLLHGASGVTVTYGYNTATSTWTVNPTTMSDGNGYWVNMNAYDVLIVQGYSVAAPPSVGGGPPPIVEYSLTTGWNLAGFTEYSYNTYENGYWAPLYVSSLQYTSTLATYFRFVYTWDPVNQQWQIIDLYADSPFNYYFYPGQGFWIYMYNSQTLIPPIPY
jgi:hypothetical protein